MSLTVVAQLLVTAVTVPAIQAAVIHVLPKTVIEKFAVSPFTLIEKSFVSTLK